MSSARRRPAVVVVAGFVLAGVAVGVLWAWLALPLRRAYALTGSGNRVATFLGDEADHYFDGAALLAGLLTAVAVVGAVAVYQWRSQRGPAMTAALLVGVGCGAAAAAAVGAALAALRYPMPDIDAVTLTPQDRVVYFTQAPAVFFGPQPLQMSLTLALPALAAAPCYAVCALLSPDDDLGRPRPAAAVATPPAVVASEGPALDRTTEDDLGGDQRQP